MPKRTVKHNHLVSTYPCNNGYVTETVNQNGETIRTAFDTNLYDAERRHNNYLRDLQEGGKLCHIKNMEIGIFQNVTLDFPQNPKHGNT